MAFDASVRVEENRLPELAKTAGLSVVDAAARELAFEVLRRAMVYLEQQVYTRPNAQVTAEKIGAVPEPTGALINSGYVRTFTGDLPPGAKSEEDALSAAKAKNPEVAFGQAPPGPAKLGQVQILFAVEYGLYVEMGTMLGMVARPFLVPAATEVQAFAESFVLAKLREAGFS